MRRICFGKFTVAIGLLIAFASWLRPLSAQTLGVYRELWRGLNSSQGNNLAILTNTTLNPNWPNKPNLADTTIFPAFEAEAGTGSEWFGQRMRTFLAPPTNGNYTLWIAGSENSALFLSTDESPDNKRLVAWVNNWTYSRQWTKESNQQSAPVPLVQGKRYYVEAIMESGKFLYNLAVRWRLPNGAIEEPIPAPRMQLFHSPIISAQPTNITVTELQAAS